jgi:DNA-binding CsgD family transcriptional regulator
MASTRFGAKPKAMKPILTKTEARVVDCVAVDSLSVKESADKMCVIYQCIANHLQVIYDKLGIKRNLQSLTKWYYTTGVKHPEIFGLSDKAKAYISCFLLMVFSVEVMAGTMDGRVLRAPRRGRQARIERVRLEA